MQLSKIGDFFARDTIRIYRRSETRTPTGNSVRVYTLLHDHIKSLIEMYTLITLSGNNFSIVGNENKKGYKIHIWNNNGFDIQDIQENDIIEDVATLKKYEIIRILPGRINEISLHKIECECDVYDTSKFGEFRKFI